jgi:molecular chaperone DnaK
LGDTHLGGKILFNEILNWIVMNFKKDQGFDLSKELSLTKELKNLLKKQK